MMVAPMTTLLMRPRTIATLLKMALRSSQLNEQELLQLKADLPGSEYVRRVAANNAAFSLKTKFAKEKYLARKQKKYVRLVALRYASLH